MENLTYGYGGGPAYTNRYGHSGYSPTPITRSHYQNAYSDYHGQNEDDVYIDDVDDLLNEIGEHITSVNGT